MSRTLVGRTALVTGGGAGIGRGVAEGLAAAGARVAVTYRLDEPSAEFLERLSVHGEPAPAFRVDATDEREVEALESSVALRFGPIDILVNNIGDGVERDVIADMDFALWRQIIATHLDSMFLLTHTLIPHVTAGGRIINIAGSAGRNGSHPGATAYATTKAGVFGFTRGLARELAVDGITVNAIAPGFIVDTPFRDTFVADAPPTRTTGGIPVGGPATPADVANVCTWLASPDSSFVSGTIVDDDGAHYFG